MTASDQLFLRSLVAIASDHGGASKVEQEYIDGLLDALGADETETAALHEWAATPRAVEDIPAEGLTIAERHTLLIHAAMLVWADGQVPETGNRMLTRLASHLSIAPEEAHDIISRAADRIRQLGLPKAPPA